MATEQPVRLSVKTTFALGSSVCGAWPSGGVSRPTYWPVKVEGPNQAGCAGLMAPVCGLMVKVPRPLGGKVPLPKELVKTWVPTLGMEAPVKPLKIGRMGSHALCTHAPRWPTK